MFFCVNQKARKPENVAAVAGSRLQTHRFLLKTFETPRDFFFFKLNVPKTACNCSYIRSRGFVVFFLKDLGAQWWQRDGVYTTE